MYFFASLSFLVVGLSLCLFTQTQTRGIEGWGLPAYFFSWTTHPYEDLGLRLLGFGTFLVVATFYQSLGRQKRGEPLKGNTFGLIE
jgi:hypothetical protein